MTCEKPPNWYNPALQQLRVLELPVASLPLCFSPVIYSNQGRILLYLQDNYLQQIMTVILLPVKKWTLWRHTHTGCYFVITCNYLAVGGGLLEDLSKQKVTASAASLHPL